MRLLWLLSLTACGCTFRVDGVPVDAAVGLDAGAIDLTAGVDLAGADLAGVDLASADLASVDLAPPVDLTPVVDLTPPPQDMTVVFTLSHLPQHFLTDGTCDLTVASAIDTKNLTIDGAKPPAGCAFTAEKESGPLDVAVLAVRSLTVNGAVGVSGTRPLVVAAGATITVSGSLDGSAVLTAPGPGGAAAHLGAGAGVNGSHVNPYSDSGGSGAGYSTMGGNGGGGSFGGGTVGATTGGPTYSDAALTMSAPAGSGGGNESSEGCTVTGGGGGAGGGSIQLSAQTSITVSGYINVGGGGGLGGCLGAATDQGSGGGGGSGGAIFLESRMVDVPGGLWANGGSGGGGASGTGTTGGNGNDGTTSLTAAAGGSSGGGYGGVGGAGGLTAAPTNGSGPGGGVANGGGGGGSAGRIVARAHGAPTLSGNVSPTAVVDSSLP